MREQRKAAITIESLEIDCKNTNSTNLFQTLKNEFASHWQGGALQMIELTACDLRDPSGQLNLFSTD